VVHQGVIEMDYAIASEQWQPRTVTVHGPAGIVESIYSAQIEPDLGKLNSDLKAFQEGDAEMEPVRLYDKDRQLIEAPVLRVEPAEVDYAVSVIPGKSAHLLPVLPSLRGEAPEQYIVSAITVNPECIAFPSGSDVHVYAVRTEPIDLTGKSRSFVAHPKLVLPPGSALAGKLPKDVEVTVEISALTEAGSHAMRTDIEVRGQNSGLVYVVDPPQLRISSHRLDVLNTEGRGQIRAVIDAAGLVVGQYRLMPQVLLPRSLDDARIEPDWVTLTVIEKGR
jgi:YbbR domain-containing protein